MATSSIIEKISVNNPKVIEKYIAAVEAAAESAIVHDAKSTAKTITNPDEMKSIVRAGLKRWGKN